MHNLDRAIRTAQSKTDRIFIIELVITQN